MINKSLDNHLQINRKLKFLFDGWYLTSQIYLNKNIIKGINNYILSTWVGDLEHNQENF